MKKTYETMEAYKVSFNANEQVAAAACDIGAAKASQGRKYTATAGAYCEISDINFGSGAALNKYSNSDFTKCDNTTWQVSNYL